MRVLLVPMLLMLASCASLSKALNNGSSSPPRRTPAYWVGRDINDLIMKVGPFTSQEQLPNGTMAYSWDHVSGARGVSSGFGSVSVSRARIDECITTYFVDPKSQKIIDWTLSRDCR